MEIAAQLVESVYQDLRKVAHGYLRRFNPGMTLQPTVLLHEAYLRLDGHSAAHWNSRTHFFATSSRAMHNVLVDYVRERTARKRGGGWERVPLEIANEELDDPLALQLSDVLALNDALNRLEQFDLRKARVVELRFFAGLEYEEISEMLSVSLPTVKRDWQFARAWLFEEIRGSGRG
jgi:RNA polymerase sigma factor (TIGR02999 family)